MFLSNAAAAFGLNVSVFLLVGTTSALTMNVAGVLKDWLLIGLSVAIFKAQARGAGLNASMLTLRTMDPFLRYLIAIRDHGIVAALPVRHWTSVALCALPPDDNEPSSLCLTVLPWARCLEVAPLIALCLPRPLLPAKGGGL